MAWRSRAASQPPMVPGTVEDVLRPIIERVAARIHMPAYMGIDAPIEIVDDPSRGGDGALGGEIAAIPLFVSSHSPIIGNFRYILRQQDKLGTRTQLKQLDRIQSKATFSFSGDNITWVFHVNGQGYTGIDATRGLYCLMMPRFLSTASPGWIAKLTFRSAASGRPPLR